MLKDAFWDITNPQLMEVKDYDYAENDATLQLITSQEKLDPRNQQFLLIVILYLIFYIAIHYFCYIVYSVHHTNVCIETYLKMFLSGKKINAFYS